MNAKHDFFDLQVNGYGGVDFNRDDLDAEGLHRACALLEAHGVSGFLATIVTEEIAVMKHRLANLAALRERDELAQKMIAGIHIEGPFINENFGYRGAHPLDAIRPANVEIMKVLLGAAKGLTRLVTLAPERDENLETTKFLAGEAVVVSAGHSDANLNELRAAIDAGLTMFTHLGNGCALLVNRHDNIVQRVLSLRDHLWICFIADGVHVPFPALGNYLRTAGLERCIIVTDTFAPAGLGPGRYTVSRWEVKIGDDMIARAPEGHLIGAVITMGQSFDNLVREIGLSPEQSRRLLCDNPREALSLT